MLCVNFGKKLAMKKLLFLVVIVLIGFSLYWFVLRSKSGKKDNHAKLAPIALNTHSDTFNQRVDVLIDAYMKLKDAFVEPDINAVKVHAAAFSNGVDSIPYAELQADSGAIRASVESIAHDLKMNAASIIRQTDITEMRKDFSALSDQMYPGFVKMINYEGTSLYVQHCPMAFDDEIGANWLSRDIEIVNPYLGKRHPKYKAGMLHCGEVKDSVTRQ